MKLLDLFCCAGGAGMGYHLAGFEVVGVDIAPQPHYPFKFIQADALTFPLGGFDAIHASPPCQAFTLAQRIQNNEHPDLIAPIRERMKATGKPYVIENVVGAPLENPVMLCGAMFQGLAVYRHRLFETNFPLEAPAHPDHGAPLRKMGRPPLAGEFMHVVGNFSGVARAKEAMGINWMVRDGLREAIPPAYTQFIGTALKQHLAHNGSSITGHRPSACGGYNALLIGGIMVCAMGGDKVRITANIKKGLLYQDGRDRIARVHDYFDGIVILDWLDTGNQSQCKEQQFCKRFSLYGKGHWRFLKVGDEILEGDEGFVCLDWKRIKSGGDQEWMIGMKYHSGLVMMRRAL